MWGFKGCFLIGSSNGGRTRDLHVREKYLASLTFEANGRTVCY